MILQRAIVLISAVLLSASALASGGYGGGGGYSGGSGFKSRPVDQAYEYGKSVYKGRNKAYGKIKYCITSEDGAEKVKLKRGSLKPYKGGTFADLAGNLYNCDAPDTAIKDILSLNDLQHVLYYLNKRYKLKLS